MINLTITTAAETITFFSADSFTNWYENENQYRIEAYKLINEKGYEWANSGMNAGAYLFEILENA
jgi:uncharacterized protein YdeI (YjbR/CyaY-like superfamily)